LIHSNDQEYHRRRSEIELEQAIAADAHESAFAHLMLARLHRERRQVIAAENMRSNGARAPILRTDKEG
jgi:hypothetical protein